MADFLTLLYTYKQRVYLRLPSMMSMKSSMLASSLKRTSALWILYSCTATILSCLASLAAMRGDKLMAHAHVLCSFQGREQAQHQLNNICKVLIRDLPHGNMY